MFSYLLKKEFTLILRDIHALLVLFIMPTLFILIMSLALKNSYSNTIDVKLKVAVQSSTQTQVVTKLIESINQNSFFDARFVQQNEAKERLYRDHYDFVLNVPEAFISEIKEQKEDFNIEIFTTPDMQQQKSAVLKSLIASYSTKTILDELLSMQNISNDKLDSLSSNITVTTLAKDENFNITPTSVQQSVPAWLVFSMFFILIPISNTFINEKNFGTISRIRSINVSLLPILISKIFPYFIINQIQVVCMILVGMYIVPLLGGDTLEISGNYGMIFLVSSVVSLGSISFALLIANIAKTTEEATTYGGISNIILAALGGIMVPKFVMPKFMQDATDFSPMSWGLESFLEVFVRGGSFSDISHYVYNMVFFAIICLILAYILLQKRS
ncbi:ABC transporter permease [Candidatus Marinarcus aquaticus]|uniref:ABC transporter n=1 Tax=Candidatus Marinarcus aquaticus TaxID=2044504 RepID=A0A4Q0XS47_9BACT|nr:ABC transporter permease [Candidatus Marinarcus aquaticus]RXJ57877.1 ABC transporter [Candidatus Marinarcus aquaticus]